MRSSRLEQCYRLLRLIEKRWRCRLLPISNRVSYIIVMNRQDALDTLRRSEPALRVRGVCHAALFGSIARGDNRPDSDIDILVEFDPAAGVTVFDYVGIKEFVATLFAEKVDVIDHEALKPHLREASARDAIYAF
jgi:predicted nucleotidyltransferase